jgi:hypothetical protein
MSTIVRDISSVWARHDEDLAAVRAGSEDPDVLTRLATSDHEIARFEDVCMRTNTHHLMSTGLRWNDELRHPMAGADVARVRTRDQVLFRGREVTILEATRMLASALGSGPAIADWTGPRGIRLGDALGLEHPRRVPEKPQDAQASLF